VNPETDVDVCEVIEDKSILTTSARSR